MKEATEYWNSLSIKQRDHFLKDHKSHFKRNSWLSWLSKDFSELPNDVQKVISEHVKEGIYKSGGSFTDFLAKAKSKAKSAYSATKKGAKDFAKSDFVKSTKKTAGEIYDSTKKGVQRLYESAKEKYNKSNEQPIAKQTKSVNKRKTQADYREDVLFEIDKDGFDYTFTAYSQWDKIKDARFHALRKKYVDSSKKIYDYVDTKNPVDTKHKISTKDALDKEGMDYVFTGYHDWKSVKDVKFQSLLKSFVTNKKNLETYIEKNFEYVDKMDKGGGVDDLEKELSDFYWKKAEDLDEEINSDKGGETSGPNFERIDKLEKERDKFREMAIKYDKEKMAKGGPIDTKKNQRYIVREEYDKNGDKYNEAVLSYETGINEIENFKKDSSYQYDSNSPHNAFYRGKLFGKDEGSLAMIFRTKRLYNEGGEIPKANLGYLLMAEKLKGIAPKTFDAADESLATQVRQRGVGGANMFRPQYAKGGGAGRDYRIYYNKKWTNIIVSASNKDEAFEKSKQQLQELYPNEKITKSKWAYSNTYFDKKAKGGHFENENREMVLNNNKQIKHHTEELAKAVKGKHVPAWVVAKVNRSASDLSDATHYMDGQGEMFAKGANIDEYKYFVSYSFEKGDGHSQQDILSYSKGVKDVLVKKGHTSYVDHFGIYVYAKNKQAAFNLIKRWKQYGINWPNVRDFEMLDIKSDKIKLTKSEIDIIKRISKNISESEKELRKYEGHEDELTEWEKQEFEQQQEDVYYYYDKQDDYIKKLIKKYRNKKEVYEAVDKVLEENDLFSKGGNITTSDLINMILKYNSEGRSFELRGAYGNLELWSKGNRLEVGSKKDIYYALVKYRFNEKYKTGGEFDSALEEYRLKFIDKMQGSTEQAAAYWIDGISHLTDNQKRRLFLGIKSYVKKESGERDMPAWFGERYDTGGNTDEWCDCITPEEIEFVCSVQNRLIKYNVHCDSNNYKNFNKQEVVNAINNNMSIFSNEGKNLATSLLSKLNK